MTTQAPGADLTIAQMAARSGFSEPTLRYYERIGLLREVARDQDSGHRRYDEATAQRVEALACLRSSGVGVADMRRYLELLERSDQGDEAARREQRDLFAAHAQRVEEEIATLRVRAEYLRRKTELWDARVRGDVDGEARAVAAVGEVIQRF
ncbi:MerR family transcriptional regulator [Kineosporia rhizophila]|uniref:MerR family transcriptional regulator n=1 Tax=Kineosporia TaxID=49184 RepID=UPI000B26A0D9|nr:MULTISPECIES: MerR family transcriptional regulator [Kineosporia]MCE0535804.1 MerR family transcriptional regulator [Kineosporia rhizophila]GLY18211.1 MerR family transcriptional regulator [Kineosporia sp. NBRC 101677]